VQEAILLCGHLLPRILQHLQESKCQLMPAMVARFAASGKPRGLVAVARDFTYILSHENRARRYRAPWAA
jgi:hypothetical protein